MGSDITLYAGHGFRIPTEGPLPEPISIDSCEHDERRGQNFCPICGTKVRDQHHTTWNRKSVAFVTEQIGLRLPFGFTTVVNGDGILIIESKGTTIENNLIAPVPETDHESISELITPILIALNLLNLAVYGCYVAVEWDD